MNHKLDEIMNLQDAIFDLIEEVEPSIVITALILSASQVIAEIVSKDNMKEAVSTAQSQIAEMVEKSFKEIEADRKMWN